ELPDEWADLVRRCMAMEADRPAPADEIMLYQMIVGAWPLKLEPTDAQGCDAFRDRIVAWQRKALREAKLRTSWAAPNDEYERLAAGFVGAVLSPGSAFKSALYSFVKRVALAGAVNGLVQAVLKMTVPGVPDFFQGTDLWDFSLVDPDNRRPVDFGTRQAALASPSKLRDMLAGWRDGRIKQYVIRTVLQLRSDMDNVFAHGDYIPLTVSGPGANNVIAFARRSDSGVVAVVLPRLIARFLSDTGTLGVDIGALEGTEVLLPESCRQIDWSGLFGQSSVGPAERISVPSLLANFPLAVLVSW
ncbi:MAG TPA: malto-oligosyltrehalose synthase, partial [Rhodopila sp.]|nr:malto-oligosyltrehalose synthase [Rhodopila sp.]